METPSTPNNNNDNETHVKTTIPPPYMIPNSSSSSSTETLNNIINEPPPSSAINAPPTDHQVIPIPPPLPSTTLFESHSEETLNLEDQRDPPPPSQPSQSSSTSPEAPSEWLRSNISPQQQSLQSFTIQIDPSTPTSPPQSTILSQRLNNNNRSEDIGGVAIAQSLNTGRVYPPTYVTSDRIVNVRERLCVLKIRHDKKPNYFDDVRSDALEGVIVTKIEDLLKIWNQEDANTTRIKWNLENSDGVFLTSFLPRPIPFEIHILKLVRRTGSGVTRNVGGAA
ncbi:hypothetical protein HDU76_008830, partial [Blyttiomyces sp. JEL0837]